MTGGETMTKTTLPSEQPISIATISTGFEKGDFLVREEQGKRLYFDFFEDAFNYAAGKGFLRMSKAEEMEWVELVNQINKSVEDMKYNTGKLLMVMARPATPAPSTSSSSSDAAKSPKATSKKESTKSTSKKEKVKSPVAGNVVSGI